MNVWPSKDSTCSRLTRSITLFSGLKNNYSALNKRTTGAHYVSATSFRDGRGPRVRQSAFFDATVAAGVKSFTIYNHMYLPVHFGDPLAEYWGMVEGVVLADHAAQRQIEITGPDALALVQF